MLEKMMIGALVVAILGVVGFGLMDAAQPVEETVVAENPPVIAPTEIVTEEAAPVVVDETAEPVAIAAEVTPERVMQVAAQDTMGEAWSAQGTVTLLEDFGFTLLTGDSQFYVELGPPSYWQAQGITLYNGDTVIIDGYYNGEQVHARVLTKNNEQLVIRTEAGQPMWAGGVDNGANQTDHAAGTANQMQVAPESWLTLTGTITSVSNGGISLALNDGSAIDLQLGRPDFWQSQGITLAVGDPVEVLGFWEGTQFMAGDIRKTATGETIMLRDPNGRQMWGGPGRNGAQADGGTQGNGSQGGNGYQGGRDQ